MSTFEIFSALPLFNKIDQDKLYELIPRISLDFDHVAAGEQIALAGTPVKGLIFLLKGKVRMQLSASVSEISGPSLLGWERVFGSEQLHSKTLHAVTSCNLLIIDKPSLHVLFTTEPAFLNAYLDMLSDAIPTSTNSLH